MVAKIVFKDVVDDRTTHEPVDVHGYFESLTLTHSCQIFLVRGEVGTRSGLAISADTFPYDKCLSVLGTLPGPMSDNNLQRWGATVSAATA